MQRSNPDGPSSVGPQNPAGDPLVAEALDWFVRLQAADGDPQTARAFRAWMEGDPGRAAAFEKITAMWGAPEFVMATQNVAKATGFSPRRKSRRRALMAKAAAAGTAAILIFGLMKFPELMIWLQADYITAAGEQRVIPLADGSTMTMNTGSAVALDFAGGRRSVKILQGEAYFDVVQQPGRPFSVAGKFSQIEVKGTAFSVKLDDDEDDVVLARGAVDVARLSQARDHAVLAPSQTVSVTAGGILPVKHVDTEKSLAWLQGRISFYDQPLGQVLKDLRRYYPGRIYVVHRRIEQIAVSGNYKLSEPARVVHSLAEAAGATVTTLPGGFIIVR